MQGAWSSVPGWGIRSHRPQWRVHILQIKILNATTIEDATCHTKARHGQMNTFFNTYEINKILILKKKAESTQEVTWSSSDQSKPYRTNINWRIITRFSKTTWWRRRKRDWTIIDWPDGDFQVSNLCTSSVPTYPMGHWTSEIHDDPKWFQLAKPSSHWNPSITNLFILSTFQMQHIQLISGTHHVLWRGNRDLSGPHKMIFIVQHEELSRKIWEVVLARKT